MVALVDAASASSSLVAAPPSPAALPAGVRESFPLYTQAVKFFAHEEHMVRTAVRAITLNVFNTADASLRRFLCRGEHSAYPEQLARHLRGSVGRLSAAVAAWQRAVLGATATALANARTAPAATGAVADADELEREHENAGAALPGWVPAAARWAARVPVTADLVDLAALFSAPTPAPAAASAAAYDALAGARAAASLRPAGAGAGPAQTQAQAQAHVHAPKSLEHCRAEVSSVLSDVLDECFYLQVRRLAGLARAEPCPLA